MYVISFIKILIASIYMFCSDMKAQPSFSQKLGVPMLHF